MRTEPEYIDIDERRRLQIHPEEDLRLKLEAPGLDFGAITFEMHYTPRNWSANTPTYDQPPEDHWDSSADPYFTIDDPELKLKVPRSELTDWRNRTMELTLVADDGEDRWVVVETTLTVAQGA